MALRMIDACSKHNTHDGQHIRVMKAFDSSDFHALNNSHTIHSSR